MVVVTLMATVGLVSVDRPEAAQAVAPADLSYQWQRTLSAPGRWKAVASSSDGSIAIAGYDLTANKLRVTENAGVSWAELTTSPTASWADLAMSDDGTVIVAAGVAVSGQSSLWISTTSGNSFTAALEQSGVTYRRVAVSGDGAEVLVLTSSGVEYSTDFGITFSAASGLGGVTEGDVAMTSDGSTMYVAVRSGPVHRSTDSGATWAPVATAGSYYWTTFDVSNDGQTLLGVISYGQPTHSAKVSIDGGNTFTEAPGVGATFTNQAARGGLSGDGRVLIAASYNATPMVSLDGGATWAASGSTMGWLGFAMSDDGTVVHGVVESSGVWTRSPVPPPTITSTSPPGLQSLGGETLAIAGTNFVGVTAVTIAGVSLPFTAVSSTQVQVTTRAMATPTVDITVATTNGSASATASVLFPGITGVSPAEGPSTGGVVGGGSTLTVSGNFYGLTVSAATIGAQSAPIVSSNEITVVLTVPPSPPGTVDVILETSTGELRQTGAFTSYTLDGPTLDSVSPSSVSWGGGDPVTLRGSGVGDATNVTIAGQPAAITSRNGRSEITVVTPGALVGRHDVTVQNAAGLMTSARALAYQWHDLGAHLDWEGLGSNGSNDGALSAHSYVLAVATLPNGDVVVGGTFSNAAGIAEADRVALWNGSTWSALGSNGSGDGALNDDVHDLVVEADGSIVAVGDFTLADGSRGVARFTGGNWVSVSAGVGNKGRVVVATPDGDLVVGGQFRNVAGDAEADYVVRWDRDLDAWQAMGSNGSGNGALGDTVRSLVVTDDGIVVGGHFRNAAGLPEADFVALWDGSAWSALGSDGSGDGALPGGYVTTVLDAATVEGTATIVAGTCLNGTGDGAAYVYQEGQWHEIVAIDLDDCVRDAVLLDDGRMLLAGWFSESLPSGEASGLVLGSDSAGWSYVGSFNSSAEAVHIDSDRGVVFVGGWDANFDGVPTADYVAMADTQGLVASSTLNVDAPGTIVVPESGGTLVELRGGGFGAETRVSLGDTPIETVSVLSSERLVFTTPSGLPELGDLIVYNRNSRVSHAGVLRRPVVIPPPPPSDGSVVTAPPSSTPDTTAPPGPATNPETPSPDEPPEIAPVVEAPSAERIGDLVPEDLSVSAVVTPGSRVAVDVGGFRPGGWVYAYMASEPVFLGAGRADGSGRVQIDVVIPNLSGDHSLVLHEPATGRLIRQVITIARVELPRTGAASGVSMWWVLLTLVPGVAMIGGVRRRRVL